MKIAVVGTGYVGLVVGACLAETGNEVVCVDKIDAKVRMLRRGRMPIYEPGLEELVQRNTKRKRLSFSTQLPKAVRASEIVFIAVGTPQDEDGSADLRHVQDVAKALVYMASLSLDSNVQFMTVMATKMPFIGRG